MGYPHDRDPVTEACFHLINSAYQSTYPLFFLASLLSLSSSRSFSRYCFTYFSARWNTSFLLACAVWNNALRDKHLTLDIDRKWQNRSLRYFQQINEIKIIHIHCTHLLGGNDGLGALCPRGRLPLTPLEDRLGDGGQLLVRHLDVVFRRRRTDETKMVSFRVTLICSTCNSNGTECSNLEAFLDETRAYYDT